MFVQCDGSIEAGTCAVVVYISLRLKNRDVCQFLITTMIKNQYISLCFQDNPSKPALESLNRSGF